MAVAFNRRGYTTFKISSNTLGYVDENGYEEEWTHYADPIYTDAYGPNVPQAEQYMGKELVLTGTLVNYDVTILRPLMAGGDGAYNTLGTIGEIYSDDSRYFTLIAQDPAGNTRTYHRCRFDTNNHNVGNRVSRFDFTIIVRDNGSGTFFTDA